MRHFKLTSAALCCLLASACSTETTNSNDVKTEAIWSDIYVTSNGNDSRVIAELNVSSRKGNNLNLVSGDKLSVTANSTTKDMEKDVDFFDIDYRVTFPYFAQDTEYEIKLYRAEEQITLKSKVTLPQAIDILAPQTEQTFPVDEVLDLRWIKATSPKDNESLKITISSVCKNGDEEISSSHILSDVEDDGKKSIDFEALELFKNEKLNNNFDCTVNFEFERRRYGTTDSRYASGSRTYAISHNKLDNINITLK
ncbi:hypothetical protein [Pseudoalteromonas sp. MMG022]|uniref:hypothetical protein n=1 Tax=Pseudoalteromonas sp. MMG022 TaxID=2909978 RepID=UPI001F415403|nr:hypothetical protein [Pseudoalteromonas sp. MMG022]MCF6436714.1 hypothetical protein [Pseudoalteromonas sp. MMG022]